MMQQLIILCGGSFLMVKFFSVLLAGLLSLSSLVLAEESRDPLHIVSSEGHFSITFPSGFGHAAKEEFSVDTELGPIQTINYISFNDTSVAMAGVGSYPDTVGASMNAQTEELFALAEEGLMMSLAGTILSSDQTTLGSDPCSNVAFTTEIEDIALLGQARFVLKGSRLYSVIFISSDPQNINSTETKHFFDSLAIQ